MRPQQRDSAIAALTVRSDCTSLRSSVLGAGVRVKYRGEIDGLRTIAVLPVILFHAGFSWLSGGFVGVDVFFVISGYLITTILADDLDSNRFSILSFYERRARRILPALFVVLFCCLPFAWSWMTPDQLSGFAKSMVAVSLFSSNILFWREAGYFDSSAAEKPLLHTWSLAVEEQYYLFFPILLFLLWRHGQRKTLLWIVILAAFSLLLSEWGWRHKPDANFYLLPTRAWELLAGSICALLVRAKGVRRNEGLSLAGLAMIVAANFIYDEHTPFPSLFSLVPVFGACLIILFASADSLVGRVLSWRPMVAIGLMSYSAYLWHQPLFAFARIRSLTTPSEGLMAGLTMVSLGFAWLSWRYVERPFRSSGRFGAWTQHSVLVAALFGCVSIAFGGWAMLALPDDLDRLRLGSRAWAYEESAQHSPLRDYCHSHISESTYRRPENSCVYLAGDRSIVVLGDSLASELSYELANQLQGKGVSVRDLSMLGCPPTYSDNSANSCARWTKEALTYLDHMENIDDLIVIYRIATDLNGPDAEAITKSLRKIIIEISNNHHVIFVMQPPPLRKAPVQLAMLEDERLDGRLPGLSRQYWEDERKAFDRELEGFLLANTDFVDTSDLFCDAKDCIAGTKGLSYYYDRFHLSLGGAKILAAAILPRLDFPGQ